LSFQSARHGFPARAIHADQNPGAATGAIALFSFAFSVAILGLGVGTVRAHAMSRSTVNAKPHCSEAEARLVQFYNRFTIAPQDEPIFQVRLPVVTFELRIAIKEELIFHVAEQLYRRKLYPEAADFYRHLLASTKRHYHQQALQRLYEIANYWLKDSWEVIKHGNDFERPTWLAYIYSCDYLSDILPDPKSIFKQALVCRNLLHWDESKPFFNEEGRAIKLLQCVHDRDPAGLFADKTLFLMGHLAWFHEDWRRADECFSRLEKKHPASRYYPYALELAIKAKLMRDDTAEERQRLVETSQLIDKALEHPRLSEEKKQDMVKYMLSSVFARQADLDFQDAEKCQKADHLDEARSRYRRICEDYPGTDSAYRAKARLLNLKCK
jgi:hypothetical protein